MKEKAVEILGRNRIAAISTVRPDGWPQTTMVGYANDGLVLYFVIFRSSQKFSNIGHDDRVSIAVGREPLDIRLAEAVYAGAIASEVTELEERDRVWRVLSERHPNLTGTAPPDPSTTALMRAECVHLSILDYSQGLGHSDALHLALPHEGMAQ